ncbi:hypothetical protein UFOVP403_11 [uncultured Caudovirales phage]|uniref:Uncharacterized protein n=1 Tax=uncultured Caudovirales phage TaxID=2100421 RepID=A0A6J5M0F2_9CAUD|nr:hypothetical protein UFOVP403_11 [uncultured Caudovirales phage]
MLEFTQTRLNQYVELGWEDPGLTTADAKVMLADVRKAVSVIEQLTKENERLQEIIEIHVESKR